MKREHLHIRNKGFSLVELLLAISLFSILVFVIGDVISAALTSTSTSAISLSASHLAEEGAEAVRSLRDASDDFAYIPDGTYGIVINNNQWELSPTPDITDIFTRSIAILTINANQKRITTTISWLDQNSQTQSITKDTYLTNWRAPLKIGLSMNKAVINHGKSKVPSDFLPVNLTTLGWDYSVDPPVQNSVDIPIVFSPANMTLGPGLYSFLTSSDPDYSLALSSDCVGNSITLADGDSKICNITYEQYVVPTVTLPTATSISSTSATLGANVTSLGNPASILARGTCWDTTAEPTTNCLAEGGTTTGVFTQARTGFTPSTTYYYRGYAINSFGTGYSADGVFITSDSATVPTVTTPTVTDVTATTAILGANVTSLGLPAVISERGTCYGTTPAPTTNCVPEGGTTTGVFTHGRSGLTGGTLYYFRGYATNSTGTAYSPDGTFTTAIDFNGILIYGDSTTIPKYRNYYSTSNTFGSETDISGSSNGNKFIIRTSPSKKEAIAGYYGPTGMMEVYCYNGSIWTKEFSVNIGGTGVRRRFDIAYETNTGDAIVLYSRNVSGTNEMAYRTKTGTHGCGSSNWSSETNFDPLRTSGTIQWVKLAWDRRANSNLITAIWADNQADLSSAVWSGSTWGNEPTTVSETSLEIVSVAQDVEDFDVEYESLSGDVMMVWASSLGTNGVNGVRYRTCTGGTANCTWSSVTIPPIFLDDATNLDISANPNTNQIMFASIGNDGSDLQIGYWSGASWTNLANIDITSATPLAGTKLVSTGWLISGSATRSIVVYHDSATTNVGWYVCNLSVCTLQTDFAPTPAFGNPQKYYDIQMDPLNKNQLIFLVSDVNNDLFAKRIVMTSTPTFTWTNADSGVALELNLAQAIYGPYSFSFWRQ